MAEKRRRKETRKRKRTLHMKTQRKEFLFSIYDTFYSALSKDNLLVFTILLPDCFQNKISLPATDYNVFNTV